MMIQVNETKDIEKVAEIVAKAFQPIAFNQYYTYNSSYEANLSYLTKRIGQFKETGLILEANDYQAIAIFVPPNVEYPPITVDYCQRYKEITEKYAKAKKKYPINNKNIWVLAFLAKDPAFKDQKGLISALIKPYLNRVKDENAVLTLKAIDLHAKEVYEHYGFKTIGEPFIFGEGHVNHLTGKPDPQGKGVTVHAMAYNS